MTRESGQATIEYTVLLPLLVIAAAVLVEVGVTFGRELSIRSAADRAAVAEVRGGDPVAAARTSLPASLAKHLRVRADGNSVVVSAPVNLPLLSSIAPISLSATAHTPSAKD